MKHVLIAALFATILSACGPTEEITITSFDGSESVQVTVELAVTPEEQKRGLMARTNLDEDAGMVFIFEQEKILSFWMKNTLIPLQIIFFDGQGAFVSVADMVPCETEECPLSKSASIAKYALEVNPGFRELHGITPGWKLTPESVQALEAALR
ncbi:MAG: DUF192 domain-containing protein [Candidatus Peribacteraceae bacterium]